MGAEDNGDMELQHTGGEGLLNCPPSDKVAGMAMGSRSMFRSSNAAEHPFFASGWEPLVSLSHTEDFGGSSMVAPNEFVNPSYPVVLENHIINSAPHLARYPPVSGIADIVPKLPCFGSGSFSEMVGAFGLPECGQIANPGCPPNYPPPVMEGTTEKTSTNPAYSQEDCQNSDEGGMGASPKGKGKRRASETHSPLNPNKNVEGEQRKDLSGDSSESPTEQGEKKRKIEQNTNANFRGKQAGKQTKDNSSNGEVPKENYIHVRARRGEATNSHSLAERVRRERISERMRLLQELVPGCNKVTGKAVMLDEIINYVQSLQQQVEFLSMKLATVNPELNINIERILSKDILHSQGMGAPVIGFGPGMCSSHPYSQGIQPGTLAGIPNTNPPFHPLPQNLWDNELQSLLQMGFDSNPANNNLGPSGISTLEL